MCMVIGVELGKHAQQYLASRNAIRPPPVPSVLKDTGFASLYIYHRERGICRLDCFDCWMSKPLIPLSQEFLL